MEIINLEIENKNLKLKLKNLENYLNKKNKNPLLILNNKYIHTKNGYINLSALCNVGYKTFTEWLTCAKSKYFDSYISFSVKIAEKDFFFYVTNSKTPLKNGTYGHPAIAIEIATWVFNKSILDKIINSILEWEKQTAAIQN
jgi:hypothetical protein